MLEKATIARPYAEALFAHALEEKKLDSWSKMLHQLTVIITDKNMRRAINSPKLSKQRLCQFIMDICGKLSKPEQNFIKIVVESKRIGLIKEISRLFEQKRAAAEQISEVNVTSAYPLQDEQIQTISKSVSQYVGKNKVHVNVEEDKSLIGGVVIQIGDSVIDASLRGRLAKLSSVFM